VTNNHCVPKAVCIELWHLYNFSK